VVFIFVGLHSTFTSKYILKILGSDAKVTVQLSEDMKEVLRSNICYFATSSKDGKPNVVPVGLVEPLSDSEVLVIDVRFNKTRKNLEDNSEVAIAVTDMKRHQAYQIKGTSKIITTGQLFDKILLLVEERGEKRKSIMKKRLEEIQDPELKMSYQKRMERHYRLKPKAVIQIMINEIYSTI
jgi:predicted pyridoxine 5'-phosphate oxidase superfamily flavin-nucleotide-binding protein